MELGAIIAICTTIVATIAGVATIMSTIRYMKSQNSKELKNQSELLKGQTQILNEMKRENNLLLTKIEEGQREGQNKLSEDNVTIAKILERIESNTSSVK